MNGSEFKQIVKLREADAMLAAGKTIGQVVQSLGVSEQSFHRCASTCLFRGKRRDEVSRNVSCSRTAGANGGTRQSSHWSRCESVRF